MPFEPDASNRFAHLLMTPDAPDWWPEVEKALADLLGSSALLVRLATDGSPMRSLSGSDRALVQQAVQQPGALLHQGARCACALLDREERATAVIIVGQESAPWLPGIAGALRASLIWETDAAALASRLAVQAELARSLHSSLHLAVIYERLKEQAAVLVGYERLALLMCMPGQPNTQLRVTALVGYPFDLLNETVDASRASVLATLVRDARPTLIADTSAEASNWAYQPAFMQAAGSWMGVPLLAASRLIGLLCLETSLPYAYNEDDLAQIVVLAQVAGPALENARQHQQFEQMAQELERRARRLDSIQRVTSLLTASLDLNTTLSRVLRLLAGLFHVEHAALIRHDKAQVAFVLAAQWPDSQQTGLILAEQDSAAYHEEMRRASAAYVLVLNAENHIPGPYDVIGAQVSLCAPLLAHDQVIGSLRLDSRDSRRTFTLDDSDMLHAIAGQLALAIRNSELYAQAIDANRLKSEFLANVSHELRTPLNAIIGYTEMLLNRTYGELNEKQADRLGRVYRSGRSLLELINDILDLSKIEAGQMELDLATIDPAVLLHETVTLYEPLLLEKGLSLTLAIAEGMPALRLDALRMHQVLANLLGNALKFTSRGGVTLSARAVTVADGLVEGRPLPAHIRAADGPWVLIAVADTGIGIPPHHQRVIFDAFRQGDGSSVREYGGTGLGLSISQRMVNLHQGHIWVESAPDEGSTFYVLLPVPRAADIIGDLALPSDNRPRILVIDDDESALQLVQDCLSGAGYHVTAISSADQALDYVQRLRPAAIITDVLMPRLDGWEVLQQLRASPDTAQIPVIVMSVLDKRTTGFYLGASDYLIKPISRGALLDSLARVVRVDQKDPILVVDDKNSHRMLVQEVLEMQGYPVVGVAGGEEALRWLRDHAAALIILDIIMPDMSGFEVLRVVRETAALRDIPIVVTTSRNLTAGERRRLEQFNAQLLAKHQMSGNALAEQVRIALNRRLQQEAGDRE